VEGKPIFFEIWESRTGYDGLIGGFFVQPTLSANEYNVRIIKDWQERITDTSPSFAKGKVRIQDKVRDTSK